MRKVTRGLWRIEYHTDLTRTEQPVIPLGYISEAHWDAKARWLGLLFRRSITPLEMDRVNLETWPELKDMDTFMIGMFDRAWGVAGDGAAEPGALGSVALTRAYSPFSAVQFVAQEFEPLHIHDGIEDAFTQLYGHLISLKSGLAPVLTAPVVSLKPRRSPAHAPMPDVEAVSKAA